MAQDDDDPVALLPAGFQPPLDQRRADPLVLEFRQDRYRGQGQRRHPPDSGDDRQVAEEDVADNPARLLGDQRHPDVAAAPKGIDEPGLSSSWPKASRLTCRMASWSAGASGRTV